MGVIVAVANQKGGVGKTTTALNLGASLAVAERRVLVVDADPQANLTSGLGLRAEAPRLTLYDALSGTAELAAAVLQTELASLHLVPADRQLTGAELELVSGERREYRLRDALRPVAAQYDYVFIDCPPSLGLLTVNGLTAADALLVPLQCEYFALEGVSELLGTRERVRAAFNPDLGLFGVLFTMVDDRTNLSQQVIAEAQQHFGERVFRTRIPRSIRLGEAPSFGKPIVKYDLRSKGAQAYLDLAKEVLAHEETRARQRAVGATS